MAIITTVCMCCNKKLKEIEDPKEGGISHGVCEKCLVEYYGMTPEGEEVQQEGRNDDRVRK